MGFNSITIKIDNMWGSEGVLGDDITTIELNASPWLINIYGPYHNRVGFWDKLMNTSFMDTDNVIIGGDLNFSLGHAESWGTHA